MTSLFHRGRKPSLAGGQAATSSGKDSARSTPTDVETSDEPVNVRDRKHGKNHRDRDKSPVAQPVVGKVVKESETMHLMRMLALDAEGRPVYNPDDDPGKSDFGNFPESVKAPVEPMTPRRKLATLSAAPLPDRDGRGGPMPPLSPGRKRVPSDPMRPRLPVPTIAITEHHEPLAAVKLRSDRTMEQNLNSSLATSDASDEPARSSDDSERTRRNQRETRDARETRETRDSRDARDNRDPRENRENKEPRETATRGAPPPFTRQDSRSKGVASAPPSTPITPAAPNTESPLRAKSSGTPERPGRVTMTQADLARASKMIDGTSTNGVAPSAPATGTTSPPRTEATDRSSVAPAVNVTLGGLKPIVEVPTPPMATKSAGSSIQSSPTPPRARKGSLKTKEKEKSSPMKRVTSSTAMEAMDEGSTPPSVDTPHEESIRSPERKREPAQKPLEERKKMPRANMDKMAKLMKKLTPRDEDGVNTSSRSQTTMTLPALSEIDRKLLSNIEDGDAAAMRTHLMKVNNLRNPRRPSMHLDTAIKLSDRSTDSRLGVDADHKSALDPSPMSQRTTDNPFGPSSNDGSEHERLRELEDKVELLEERLEKMKGYDEVMMNMHQRCTRLENEIKTITARANWIDKSLERTKMSIANTATQASQYSEKVARVEQRMQALNTRSGLNDLFWVLLSWILSGLEILILFLSRVWAVLTFWRRPAAREPLQAVQPERDEGRLTTFDRDDDDDEDYDRDGDGSEAGSSQHGYPQVIAQPSRDDDGGAGVGRAHRGGGRSRGTLPTVAEHVSRKGKGPADEEEGSDESA